MASNRDRLMSQFDKKRRYNFAKPDFRGAGTRIQGSSTTRSGPREDEAGWNPRTMGNKRGRTPAPRPPKPAMRYYQKRKTRWV